MIRIGLIAICLSAFLFVLYLVLPYERIRRLKIKLYRRNIANFDRIFENSSEKLREACRVLRQQLNTERRSFTIAWPATILAIIGIALGMF